VHRVVERFGPLVHVFSTYEGRREGNTKPFVRGINSIQARARWEALVGSDGGLDSRDAGPATAREVPAAGQTLTPSGWDEWAYPLRLLWVQSPGTFLPP
jgi:hypothetical protein